MSAEKEPRLAYSPALDGLRAVAVLSVMLYHGGVAWVGGGFLGVDVFFVLSGFLITTLLLLEFEASEALDLKGFWARRARRLLPALFVVLFVVVLYGLTLRGEAAAALRADAVATLFYVSNWWFIFSGNSYFQQFSDPSPLTHTWSLAIEEQWYLLLPLVLVLLLPRVRSRRWWGLGFGVLALVSAAWMAFLFRDGSDPSREYYGTDTRLQALLVGAMLAALLTPGVLDRLRRVSGLLAPLALLGVVAMMLLVADSDQWMYRGGFLLIAVLAGLLIAAVMAHPNGLVGRALSVSPLVWVGTISYGLYLWHWPVYVFLSPARTGLSGPGLLALRIAVTFAVATASFYLIERPVRSGALSKLSSGGRLAVVLGTPALLLALVGVGAAVSRPPAADSLEAIRDAATSAPTVAPPAPTPSPSADAGDGPVTAVLVGDSVALSVYAAQQQSGSKELTALPAAEFGCGLLPFEASLNGVRMPIRPECVTWEDARAGRIAGAGADLGVLFAGPWEQYDRWDGGPVAYTDRRWREATEAAYGKVLDEMAAATKKQAVVLNHCHGAPELDLPDAVLYQAGRYPGVVNDPRRIAAVNDAVTEAAEQRGIPVIDPSPLLCDGGYRAQIDGVEMHTDGVHFTLEGGRLYWDWLTPRLLKVARSAPATPEAPAP